MDFHTETGSKNVDSSLWSHNSKSLADILTEINQNVQSMLRLVEDSEPVSTEKFLCLYQSLGETYNDLNQELLNGLLKFDFKLPCSDHNNASSSLVTSTAHLSSFKPDVSLPLELDLESGTSYSSLKHQLVSPGRTTSSEMLQSLKLDGDVDKNQSAFLLADDMFCAELETARRELEAKNLDIETEKRHVLDLESKLLDSSYKIENLESELDEVKECLGVSEAEVSKLLEMLNECKSEKAKLQTGNAADLLDSLRVELRSRENQIEQMEEYLNQVGVKDTEIMSESGADKNVVEELRARVEVLEKQTGNAADLLDSLRAELRSRETQIEQMEEYLKQVCVKETEIMSESGADKNVVEELRARVEVLEKQVELQRNVISETEEEKREAIRQLCFSLDHYRSRYLEIVRTLSDKKR